MSYEADQFGIKLILAILIFSPWLLVAVYCLWRAVGWGRFIAAELFTFFGTIFTFIALGISQFGDCAEDVIGPVPGNPCHVAKDHMAATALSIGLTILFVGNWLILRRRRV